MAIGRRGQLDNNAIVRYIINGLDDNNLRKSLSAMSFKKCSDLLRSLQSIVVGSSGQVPNIQSKRNLPIKKNNSDGKVNENVSAKTAPNIIVVKLGTSREIVPNRNENQEIR